MPKYICALIAVSDIAASRRFYEGILGQTVQFDFGQNVSYEGSFAIHQKEHFAGLLGEGREARVPNWAGELYFEEDGIEELARRLEAAGTVFVHPIREQPWAQRVLRCLDPDGHVVEIGESLEAVARRLLADGMEAAQVAARISMPIGFVQAASRPL